MYTQWIYITCRDVEPISESGLFATTSHISVAHYTQHTNRSNNRSSTAMPGKHVHFYDVDVPSPASSSSSTLPSSPEPTTPPPLGFGSPYQCVALPGNATPHPLLCKPDLIQQCSFDISKYPAGPSFNSIPAHMWDQPASRPPMSSMVFFCDLLPWSFTIIPRSGSGTVTVADVYHGIYAALRKGVTASEFQTLSVSAQTEVTSAYNARCKVFFSNPTLYDQELSKGVKRVDFLGKCSYFVGITYVKRKGGRWQMITSTKS